MFEDITGAFSALGKKLTPSAEAVTESLVATNDGDEQGYQEINHSQPRKEDVEKAQSEIDDRPDP